MRDICRIPPRIPTGELGDFELLRDVSLDAGEEDFALAGFKAVDGRGKRSLVVGIGKLDEFLVDKLCESDVSRAFAVEEHLAQPHFLPTRSFLSKNSRREV